jgi:class 3 adenylate cyclase
VPEETPTSVLFADISDHTKLFVEYEAAVAARMVRTCLDLMIEAVREAQGAVVEEVGDEVLAWFDDPEKAALAASRIQVTTKTGHLRGRFPRPMRVRAAFAHGPVLRDERGIAGQTVILAHRLLEAANVGQILVDRATKDRLPPLYQTLTRPFATRVLKGLRDLIEIHELVWDVEKTQVLGPPRTVATGAAGVVLEYEGETRRVDRDHQEVVIGRDETCGLRVQGDSVSRHHVRVRWEGDKVVVEDKSTNGTAVEPDGAAARRLHRQVVPLTGSGTLRLGDPAASAAVAVVRYRSDA